ncbi:MAG: hypothetical protein P1Q69_08075 [Candidatus Thorarchaeota archaeon]|nr:hypothetical protein [Candidatus Thorarchaeota archaeon]
MIESVILIAILSIASFSFILSFFREMKIQINLNTSRRFGSLFVLIIWGFSIVSFFFAPSNNDLTFVHWVELGYQPILLSYLTFSLALFWPGFVATYPMRNKLNLSYLERIFLSFVVSLGFVTLLTFFGNLVSTFYNPSFVQSILLFANIVGMLCYFGVVAWNNLGILTQPEEVQIIEFEIFSKIALLSCIAYAVLGVFFIQTSFTYSLYGDMLSHHGYALELYLGGALPVQSGYYPWYQPLLALVFGLSRLPTLNTFVLLSISFPVFYVVGFYIFVRSFTKMESPIPELATYILITFGGFEWIIALGLLLTGSTSITSIISDVSRETVYGIIYSSFSNIYYFMPMMIGYLSLFCLLFILFKISGNASQIYHYTLLIIPLISIIGILYHGPEFLYYEVIIAGIFMAKKDARVFLKTQIAVIISAFFGLVFVTILRLPILSQYIYAIAGSIGVTIGVLVVQKAQSMKLFHRVQASEYLPLVSRALLPTLVITGLLLYISSFPLQFSSLVFYYEIIPWYLYSIRLGIAIMFFAISILFFGFGNPRIKELSIALLLLMIFAKFSTIMNVIQLVGYLEARLLTPLLMVLAIGVSIFIVRIVNLKFKHQKIVLLGILALLLCGPITTVVQVQYWSYIGESSYTNVPHEVIDALQFLRNNMTARDNVMVLQERYFPMVLGMTPGRAIPRSWFTYGELRNQANLCDFSDSLSLLQVLSSYDVHYIFTDHGISEIENQSALHKILPLLPVIFSNGLIMIYSVPLLADVISDKTVHFLTSGDSKNSELDYLMSSHKFGNTTWSDMLTGWSNSESGEVEISSEFAIGPASLRFRTSSSAIFLKQLPSVNISDGSLVQFYLKSISSSLMIRLGSSNSDFYYTYLDTSHSDFHLISVQLGNSSSLRAQGNPSWSDINHLEFLVIGTPGEVLINGLTLIPPDNTNPSGSYDRVTQLLLGFQMSNINCQYRPEFNGVDYCDVLVLPEDSNNRISLNISKPALYNWIDNGGSIVIFGNGANGDFFDLLQLNHTTSIYANGLIHDEMSYILPAEFQVPLLTSSDTSVIPLSTYTLDGVPSSNATFMKEVGLGKIIYVLYDPLLELWKSSGFGMEIINLLRTTFSSFIDSTTYDYNIMIQQISQIAQGARINAGLTMGPVSISGAFSVQTPRLFLGDDVQMDQIMITSLDNSVYSYNALILNDLTMWGDSVVLLEFNGSGRIQSTTSNGISLVTSQHALHATIISRLANSLNLRLTIYGIENELSFSNIKSFEFRMDVSSPLLIGPGRVLAENTANLTKSYVFEQVIQSLSAREGTEYSLGQKPNFTISSIGGISFLSALEVDIPDFESVFQRLEEWMSIESQLSSPISWMVFISIIPTFIIFVLFARKWDNRIKS